MSDAYKIVNMKKRVIYILNKHIDLIIKKKHQLHRKDLLKLPNIEKTELMNIKVQRTMPASQKLG